MGVRDRFDGVEIGVQGAREQQLAVAGGADAGDVERDAGGGVAVSQVDERAAGHFERAVVGDKRKLRGGAARIDAEPRAQHAVARVGARGGAVRPVGFGGQLVALLELPARFFAFEKRLARGVVGVGAGEVCKALCGG